MKSLILFLLALFTVTIGFAQEVAALDPSFSAIKSLLLPAVTGGALLLLAEAKKYMFTPQWDTNIFIKTNVLPFGLSIGGAIILYLLIAYVPFLTPFLEILTESDLTEITSASLIGAATVFIKNVMIPRVVEPEDTDVDTTE